MKIDMRLLNAVFIGPITFTTESVIEDGETLEILKYHNDLIITFIE